MFFNVRSTYGSTLQTPVLCTREPEFGHHCTCGYTGGKYPSGWSIMCLGMSWHLAGPGHPQAQDLLHMYETGTIMFIRLHVQTKTLTEANSRWVFSTDPLNTWRNNDVVIASKRRHFDVITSKWRRFDVITTLLLRHVFRGESALSLTCVYWNLWQNNILLSDQLHQWIAWHLMGPGYLQVQW